jgi:hypothetical protein
MFSGHFVSSGRRGAAVAVRLQSLHGFAPVRVAALRRRIIIPRRIDVRDALRLNHRALFENGLPIVGWPDMGFTGPVTTESAQSDPVVIVVPTAPQPSERPPAITSADSDYVPGCHAISHGYVCDVPRDPQTP